MLRELEEEVFARKTDISMRVEVLRVLLVTDFKKFYKSSVLGK